MICTQAALMPLYAFSLCTFVNNPELSLCPPTVAKPSLAVTRSLQLALRDITKVQVV